MLAVSGHVPAQEEAVEVDGVRLVAQRVLGRRISRVRIERNAPTGPVGD
jgi:CBS domain containing-hemolysin-like protein